jgi:hypothetical protein
VELYPHFPYIIRWCLIKNKDGCDIAQAHELSSDLGAPVQSQVISRGICVEQSGTGAVSFNYSDSLASYHSIRLFISLSSFTMGYFRVLLVSKL